MKETIDSLSKKVEKMSQDLQKLSKRLKEITDLNDPLKDDQNHEVSTPQESPLVEDQPLEDVSPYYWICSLLRSLSPSDPDEISVKRPMTLQDN